MALSKPKTPNVPVHGNKRAQLGFLCMTLFLLIFCPGALCSGKKPWEGKRFNSDPVFYKGLVILNKPNVIECYEVDTGERRWVAPLEKSTTHKPVVNDGFVVVKSHHGLICLRLANGKRVWSKPDIGMSSPGGGELLISKNRVYACTTRAILAVGLESGDELWRHAHDGSLHRIVVLLDEGLFIIAQPHDVVLDPDTGKLVRVADPKKRRSIRWQFRVNESRILGALFLGLPFLAFFLLWYVGIGHRYESLYIAIALAVCLAGSAFWVSVSWQDIEECTRLAAVLFTTVPLGVVGLILIWAKSTQWKWWEGTILGVLVVFLSSLLLILLMVVTDQLFWRVNEWL